MSVSDVFVTGFGPVARVFDLVGGADANWYRLVNIAADFEGVASPSECLVPAGRQGPFRTGLRWNAAVDRMTGATERHSTG